MLPVFLERFGARSENFLILVLDNAPAHIARTPVAPPANVVLVNLPPYCP